MVLVDTSVLVNYFKGLSDLAVEKFDSVLRQDIPFGITDYIYQELLQGAKDRKEFLLLDSYLSTQRFYAVRQGRKSFREAAHLFQRCRSKGFTIRSSVDLLIAQTAVENDLFLLHNDRDFTAIASVEKSLKIY